MEIIQPLGMVSFPCLFALSVGTVLALQQQSAATDGTDNATSSGKATHVYFHVEEANKKLFLNKVIKVNLVNIMQDICRTFGHKWYPIWRNRIIIPRNSGWISDHWWWIRSKIKSRFKWSRWGLKWPCNSGDQWYCR